MTVTLPMKLPTSVVGSHGLPGWVWLAREAMEAGRLGALDLRELMEDATQAALLDQAPRFLKPGGRIAYVTCSVLDAENGGQVRGFVARDPGFAVAPPAEVAKALGDRGAILKAAALTGAEGILLTPRRTDTDGFFISVLAAPK